MLKNEIGINAGKIWQHLDSKSNCTLKDLKKTLELSEKDILLAIGWLYREDQIGMYEENKVQMFYLIY
jgi:hypothetical protein